MPTLVPTHRDCRPFHHRDGTTCAVIVHGFTGCPKEMRQLGRFLADRGFSVRGVRLKGHGTAVEIMARCTWEEWVGSVRKALRQAQSRYPRVVLVGFSLGGAISLYLAARENVAGVVSLSAPVETPDWRLYLAPILQHFFTYFPALEKTDLLDPEAVKEMYSYKWVPLPAVVQLMKFLPLAKASLPAVSVPVLILHGRRDGAVPPRQAEVIFRLLGTKKKAMHHVEGGHGIVVDRCKEEVFVRTARFLAQLEESKQ